MYGYSLVPVMVNSKRVRTEYDINEEGASFVRELWERHWKQGIGYRFPDSEAVNAALRAVLAAAKTVRKAGPRKRTRAA